MVSGVRSAYSETHVNYTRREPYALPAFAMMLWIIPDGRSGGRTTSCAVQDIAELLRVFLPPIEEDGDIGAKREVSDTLVEEGLGISGSLISALGCTQSPGLSCGRNRE